MTHIFRYNDWQVRQRKGFTLIELSIVLIIVGLLVGGVLVGNDLINAAKIRREFSQVEKLDAAVLTFRLKYNGLPGDLPNPQQFGFSDPDSAGDGNGQIKGTLLNGSGVTISAGNFHYSSGSSAVNSWDDGFASAKIPEWAIAQQQLSAAKLVSELEPWVGYVDFTTKHDGGKYLVSSDLPLGSGEDASSPIFRHFKPAIIFGYEFNSRISGHYHRLGISGPPFPGLSVVASYLRTPKEQKAIDAKFDDGKAASGRMQAAPWFGSGCPEGILGTSANCMTAGGATGNLSDVGHCLSAATQDYDTDYNANACAIRVKAAF